MVADEAPHLPRRKGEVGNNGILDSENGGFRAGEKEVRRDLEQRGGYVEGAAEAEGPGGVECEAVGRREWNLGAGVLQLCVGDESQGKRHGHVQGGVPPV